MPEGGFGGMPGIDTGPRNLASGPENGDFLGGPPGGGPPGGWPP